MILLWLIVAPLAAGVVAACIGRRGAAARWVCLAGAALQLALGLVLWGQSARHDACSVCHPLTVSGGVESTPTPPDHGQGVAPSEHPWQVDLHARWVPDLGISFHLAADGLSLLLVLLTAFLGLIAVAASWREITERVGFFHLNLMWVLAGITGVFLARDLFLFYFFWELMLIPMYFLIEVWGHERRHYAAVKFLLFTQLSGLLMLASIVGLYVVHGRATGVYTFEYADLIGTRLGPSAAMWLMLGFFVAFAVKLPAVPVHTWLPDAHTEAPTAGSVILAGLLLKTGAYGLLRFVVPLFPQAAAAFAPIAMTLGVIGILYGAILAFAQTDLKRLVAYTSVSHLGFVLLGIFAGNTLALQGVVMQIICHGLSTGGLFILVGMLQERLGTRDLRRMGGLWSAAPRMGGFGFVLALGALGLPGLGNFVAEFLILLGAWQVSPALTAIACGGFILSVIYALWMVQRVFHGPSPAEWKIADVSPREAAVMGVLVVTLVWLGLYPRPVFRTAAAALKSVGADLRAGPNRAGINDGPPRGAAPTAAPGDPRAGGRP